MKRLTRIIAGICMAVLLATSVSGCTGGDETPYYEGYQGAYPGAYTLMYNQVPGVKGVKDNRSYYSHDPQIVRVDTDDRGRALYAYFENAEEMISIGIVQTETENTVAFYPEASTLSDWVPDRYYDCEFTDDELLTLIYEIFSVDQIEELKAMNDWNAPLNQAKLDSAPIIPIIIESHYMTQRVDSVNLSELAWEKHVLSLARKNGLDIHFKEWLSLSFFTYAYWMATDAYGRRLYYVEGIYTTYPTEEDNTHVEYSERYFDMIAIINPDGSFNEDIFMAELVDKTDYQEPLRALKAANGWNQPLE